MRTTEQGRNVEKKQQTQQITPPGLSLFLKTLNPKMSARQSPPASPTWRTFSSITFIYSPFRCFPIFHLPSSIPSLCASAPLALGWLAPRLGQAVPQHSDNGQPRTQRPSYTAQVPPEDKRSRADHHDPLDRVPHRVRHWVQLPQQPEGQVVEKVEADARQQRPSESLRPFPPRRRRRGRLGHGRSGGRGGRPAPGPRCCCCSRPAPQGFPKRRAAGASPQKCGTSIARPSPQPRPRVSLEVRRRWDKEGRPDHGEQAVRVAGGEVCQAPPTCRCASRACVRESRCTPDLPGYRVVDEGVGGGDAAGCGGPQEGARVASWRFPLACVVVVVAVEAVAAARGGRADVFHDQHVPQGVAEVGHESRQKGQPAVCECSSWEMKRGRCTRAGGVRCSSSGAAAGCFGLARGTQRRPVLCFETQDGTPPVVPRVAISTG